MDAYLFNTIIKVWMENMYTNWRPMVTYGDSEKKVVVEEYHEGFNIICKMSEVLSKNGKMLTSMRPGC